MRRVVSVSLGSSKRNKTHEVEILGEMFRIERIGTDPYGRTLAMVNVNGVDAGEYLIARRMARPWR